MPRLTTLDSRSFQDVWGYCAIVGTRELLWSGYRIADPAAVEGLDDYVASLSAGLSLASPRSRKIFTDGAVCWLANALVEETRQRSGEGADEADALLATALARVVGLRYFVVLLERRGGQPLAATVEPVAVDSPEDARDYILHHPRVLALEAAGMQRLSAAGPRASTPADLAFTCERLHGPVN
ncbi:MAG: hypothetical protein ACM35H_09525 [Bacteroidota bacterium]